MSRLIITTRILLLVCVVLALAGSAAWPYYYQYSTNDGTRKLDVTATVTWIDNVLDPHNGMYKYQYVVAFTGSWSPKPLSNFGVVSAGHLEWVDAYTSRPDKYLVADMPVYQPTNWTQTSVTWSTATPVPYAAGGSVEFGYYSRYGSTVVTGSGGGGGATAYGSTLGMVPEPGTLAAFGLGLSGMAGYLVRGARRRRK